MAAAAIHHPPKLAAHQKNRLFHLGELQAHHVGNDGVEQINAAARHLESGKAIGEQGYQKLAPDSAPAFSFPEALL